MSVLNKINEMLNKNFTKIAAGYYIKYDEQGVDIWDAIEGMLYADPAVSEYEIESKIMYKNTKHTISCLAISFIENNTIELAIYKIIEIHEED